MARVAVTEAELVAALAEAIRSEAPEDARTVQQLALAAGVPTSRVIKTLNLLHADGRVVAHRVPHVAIDGRRTTVPAYTILPPPKGKR
jgi:prolyl-tRNA editing enzyme YbaK/EbsC (Cys-tRNA(Pro) deacylase)